MSSSPWRIVSSPTPSRIAAFGKGLFVKHRPAHLGCLRIALLVANLYRLVVVRLNEPPLYVRYFQLAGCLRPSAGSPSTREDVLTRTRRQPHAAHHQLHCFYKLCPLGSDAKSFHAPESACLGCVSRLAEAQPNHSKGASERSEQERKNCRHHCTNCLPQLTLPKHWRQHCC